MVIKDIENWSVVLVGFWNQKIFNPEWLTKQKITKPNEQVEVNISIQNNSPFGIRYGFDDVHLQVFDRRLILNPTKDEDKILKTVENTSIKILELLEHTPVSGIGVNFQFIDEKPDSNKYEIFRFNDPEQLSDHDFEVLSSAIQRRLIREGQIINLTISNDDKNRIIYNFNYHSDASTSLEAIKHLKGSLIRHKKESIDLLESVYKQTLRET